MKEKSKTNLNRGKEKNRRKDDPEGYPIYPESDDIYGKCHKDRSINPEDPTKANEPLDNIRTGINNQKDFNEDVSGSDLDIPGSELDRLAEMVGSEDEENHYYSLGGDEHNDLEEDEGLQKI